MKTVRSVFFSLSLLLCNIGNIGNQMTYANDGLNIVAILVVQTLLQVMFPSLSVEQQIQLQASAPAPIFRSVAGGQNVLQQLFDNPEMAQIYHGPVEFLEVALARVRSQIDAGQLVLQQAYPYSATVVLQQQLNSEIAVILESVVATYPTDEQAGIRQLMVEKVRDFVNFLRSRISTE